MYQIKRKPTTYTIKFQVSTQPETGNDLWIGYLEAFGLGLRDCPIYVTYSKTSPTPAWRVAVGHPTITLCNEGHIDTGRDPHYPTLDKTLDKLYQWAQKVTRGRGHREIVIIFPACEAAPKGIKLISG